MDKRTKMAIAENLDKLMKHHGLSQKDVEGRSGVSQRTISNILNADADPRYSPTIHIIEKLAASFSLPAWQLQIPDLPIEVLTSHNLAKIVDAYSTIDQNGRDMVSRISEAEARYSSQEKPDQKVRSHKM